MRKHRAEQKLIDLAAEEFAGKKVVCLQASLKRQVSIWLKETVFKLSKLEPFSTTFMNADYENMVEEKIWKIIKLSVIQSLLK